MFAVKDQDPQKKAVASRSKGLDGQTHSGPQMREPVGSLRSLQRNLGNGYLQASQPTSTQMPTDVNGLLQRACACGSTCANCATKGNEQPILQPKLAIGSPNDRYEQEADRVADQIMRMPEPSIQRQMEPEEDEAEGMVQRKIATSITPLQRDSTNQDQFSEVPPSVHDVLQSPGQPLDPATRSLMEPRFGHDFSRVRVHTDAAAERSARDVSAKAYTVERNIVFGKGQFAPQTTEGKRLLAHELAHVVQQRQTESAIAGERETEWDAHEVSRQVESGSRPAVSKRAVQGSIQREPKPRRFNPTTDLPPELLEDLKRKGLITGDAPGPVIVGNVDPDLAAAALEALKSGRSPQVKSAAPLKLPWFFPSPAGPAVELSAPVVPFGLSLWPPVNLDQVPPRAKPAPAPKSPPKVSHAPAAAPKLVSAAGLPVTQAQLDALSSEALLAEMGKTLDWLRTNKVSSKESDQVGRYFSALCAVYRQQKDEIELRRRFSGHARSPAQIASDTVAALALKDELTHRFPAIVEPWEIPIQILKPENRAEDSQIVDSGITLWSSGIEGTGGDTKLGFSTRNLDSRYLDNFSSLSVDPWTHDYVAWFPDGTQVAIPRALIDEPGADGSYSINTPGGVREFKPKDSTAAPVVLPPKINKASLPRLLEMIEKNRDTFDTAELLNLVGRNVITHESMGEAGDTVSKIMMALMVLKAGTPLAIGAYNRWGPGSSSSRSSALTRPGGGFGGEEEGSFVNAPKVKLRMQYDSISGEATGVAIDPSTGKPAMVRINMRTGEGYAIGSEGETALISGFKLVPPRPALTAGTTPLVPPPRPGAISIWPLPSGGREFPPLLPSPGAPSGFFLPPALGPSLAPSPPGTSFPLLLPHWNSPPVQLPPPSVSLTPPPLTFSPVPADVGDAAFRARMLYQTKEAMRANIRNTIGTGGETVALITTPTTAIDLNMVKKNFDQVDILSREGFMSVKTYSGDTAIPRYLKEIRALRAAEEPGVPTKLGTAADRIAADRERIQATGAWPTGLAKGASPADIAQFINKRGMIAVPAEQVVATREALATAARANPEAYGLTPGPGLEVGITRLTQRVVSSGLSHAEILEISKKIFNQP